MASRFLLGIAFFMFVANHGFSADPTAYEPVSADNLKVAQTLLGLVHTVEVQKELGVNDTNRRAFETGLREIDAQWWPSRLMDIKPRRKLVSDLEKRLDSHIQQVLGQAATRRLHQIEYQSQGIRVLARPEIARRLQFDEKQNRRLNALFAETDRLAAEIDTRKPDEGQLKAVQKARSNETKLVQDMMSNAQLQTLKDILGQKIELAGMERIYPLAPELVTSRHDYGGENVELEKLRGKVVLIHFYAFQCHNCVANFKHYKRWSETLRNRGVEVIGIQTPETPAERDPEKITAAAKREGFSFPVIMDLENKNWNAWGNTMWPTVYVVDKNGYIRMWWQGELNWDGATGDRKIEELVDRLLKEAE